MHILMLFLDVVLAVYIGREVILFVPRYRQLKQALANGDTQARARIYRQALVFEWASVLLALLALGLDWNKLNPRFLALDTLPLFQNIPRKAAFDRGALGGILAGVAAGTVGFIIARLRANRRGVPATGAAVPLPRWRKLLPDFTALIPVTTQERLLWTAVAASAGICEEIVFRGWLLATLHGPLSLSGTALVLAAAVIFGLAHAYQGVTGVILTALAGAFFCGLYVVTGSLLVPILLHIVIDARFAILPAPRKPSAQTAFA